MLLSSLKTARVGTDKGKRHNGVGQVLGRDFRNHRWKLVLISALAVAVLVALTVTAVVTQRGDRASAKEPTARLGIGLTHCPKAEPEELPPNALAGATNAALAYFEDVVDAEGQYAVSATRGLDGDFSGTTAPSYLPSAPGFCKGAASS